jgi:hypothetical protein
MRAEPNAARRGENLGFREHKNKKAGPISDDYGLESRAASAMAVDEIARPNTQLDLT